MAKGYYGAKASFRPANQQVMKSLNYAYRDRRVRSRTQAVDYPHQRCNPGQGLSYSRFIGGLKRPGLR